MTSLASPKVTQTSLSTQGDLTASEIVLSRANKRELTQKLRETRARQAAK